MLKLRNCSIVILLVFLVALAGCAEDQYAIEKKYWQAKKAAEKVFKNPNASPPRELQEATGALSHFIKKHAQSNLTVDADFTIARLYIVKKEYEKARTHLRTLLDKYKSSPAVCAEALFLTGNSYEIEDKWTLALGQYRRIVQDYTLTPRGITIPVYIAQHYKIKYEPEKMIAAYQDAIAQYQALSQKYPSSQLAYTLDIMIARCYAAIKDWQKVIDSYAEVMKAFKEKVSMDGILMNMALIYKNELQDNARARQTLEQLIKDYPKSELLKMADKFLKEWQEK